MFKIFYRFQYCMDQYSSFQIMETSHEKSDKNMFYRSISVDHEHLYEILIMIQGTLK